MREIAAYRPTNAELIAEFVGVVDRSPKTLHKYERHLVEFCAWLDGRPLLEIRRPDVAGPQFG